MTLSLAALAGVLTMLNPCVLPLLPVVVSAALARSPAGLLALAVGMTIAFTGTGTVFASSGRLLGLEAEIMRLTAAVLMVVIAALLLSSQLQYGFARATLGMASGAQRLLSWIKPEGAGGQFSIGLLLGLVWAPCIGPTLGAAIVLAARGEQLAEVAVVMAVFSFAAVVPLVLVGLASRAGFARNRERAMRFGRTGRLLMGYGLLAIGLLILTGGDKWLEALILDYAPNWLVDLTTRF